ncbi:hypothetical protein VitviT2T_024938 [Vitis vinifera]|uniref:Uncharacterized protein n=1 Tax=Vitis vinifera TaxID=29760 RepID=A0ABY9DJ93_VITVI|nr:hypothetical protein VitviT2T_024938 [Vitis vinifera]
MSGSLLSAIYERCSVVSFSKCSFRALRSWRLPERTSVLSIDRQEDGLILLINLNHAVSWRAVFAAGDKQVCPQSRDHRKVRNQPPPCLCCMREDLTPLMPGNSQGLDGHPRDLKHHQNHLVSCDDRRVAFLCKVNCSSPYILFLWSPDLCICFYLHRLVT